MNNTKKTKPLTKIAVWLIAIAFAISSFTFMPFIADMLSTNFAFASDEVVGFVDFAPRNLGLENPRFASSSGEAPGAPTGWTQTVFPNINRGATISGVFDLNEYNASEDIQEEFRLTDYAELAGRSPRPLPSHRVAMADGENRFLMINTTEETEATIVGYNSSALTLTQNSFFRISAWVQTGQFNNIYGAAIRINGIEDHSIAFTDIRTLPAGVNTAQEIHNYRDNHEFFGWERFTFFIATSALASETVHLTLTVGDFYSGFDIPRARGGEMTLEAHQTSGYAFFDNIEAYEISPTMWHSVMRDLGYGNGIDFSDSPIYHPSNTEHIQFVDLSLVQTDPGINLSFQNTDPSGVPVDWTFRSAPDTADVSVGDIVRPFVYNTALPFNPNTNAYNLEEQPISPMGLGSGNDNILILSSFDASRGRGEDANYHYTASGFVSNSFTIPMLSYYRLSVWTNTNNIGAGAGATISVETNVEDTQAQLGGEHSRPNMHFNIDSRIPNLRFVATGRGGGANDARHGWMQQTFYIRGSFFRDYEISLGLWLGFIDNHSSGTAMFANITFEELTAEQFALHSPASIGGIVDIDNTGADTSAIPNGNFILFDDSADLIAGENRFPLGVPQWTFHTPATVHRMPFSTDISFHMNHVDDNGEVPYIITGIMPISHEHFNTYQEQYGFGAIMPNVDSPSVMYMSSSVPTAFNYTSSQFTLSEIATQRVRVNMMVDNVPVGDYGASLVLLDDNGVISSIQNISNTGRQFANFDFYIEGYSTPRNLTIEIWLGFHERAEFNRNKLSRGNLYINSVDLEEVTLAEFEAREREHKIHVNLGINQQFNFAVFSYRDFGFNAFDAFDTNFIRFPRLWSISGPQHAPMQGITSGIFDSTLVQDATLNRGAVPTSFRNSDARDENGNLDRHNVLMLRHAIPTASRLTFDRPFNLQADSYYRLSIALKVDISPTDTGAGVGVSIGDEFYFGNIGARYIYRQSRQEVNISSYSAQELSSMYSRGEIHSVMDTAYTVDSYSTVDNEAFKLYHFYIYSGDAPQFFHLNITLGGELASEYSMGRVYVNFVAFENISSVEFEERIRDLRSDTTDVLEVMFGERVAQQPDDDHPLLPDTAPIGCEALTAPGIIFGVAIVIILLLVIGKKSIDNIKVKRAKAVLADGTVLKKGHKARYDRDAYNEYDSDDLAKLSVDGLISDIDEDMAFESFDDDFASTTVVDDKDEKVVTPKSKLEVVVVKKETTEEASPSIDDEDAKPEFVDDFDE